MDWTHLVLSFWLHFRYILVLLTYVAIFSILLENHLHREMFLITWRGDLAFIISRTFWVALLTSLGIILFSKCLDVHIQGSTTSQQYFLQAHNHSNNLILWPDCFRIAMYLWNWRICNSRSKLQASSLF